MKSITITLLVLALCISASITQAAPQSKPILENIFTLELTFGDKDVPDEYLLVRPLGIAIVNNGDIIVSDEYKLKIFNSDGKPKKIIGRQGQGPGEFEGFPSPNILENGNIIAIDIFIGKYSIFNTNYSFVETKNLRNNPLLNNFFKEKGWGGLLYNSIYPYSSDNIFIYTKSLGPINSNNKRFEYFLILYQKGEKIETVVESAQERLEYKGYPLGIPSGGLIYKLLPDKKVVYSETHKDKINENGKWFYIIYEYDLNTQQRRVLIKNEYTPVAFPDSILHPEKQRGYKGDDIVARNPSYSVTRKEMDQKSTELMEKLKVYPGIFSIFYDRDLLFVRTYKFIKNKGWLVDIFDSTTGKYLRSAYFPFIPVIKDGYAYRSVLSADEFPYIEKYKIDPAIYGK
jgi:hypothetical protein